MTHSTTITYIATPKDSRCAWWAAIIEPKFLTVEYLTKKMNLDYLKRKQDLELEVGQFIIRSEAIHHRHSRGYCVQLGVVTQEMIQWLNPSINKKIFIKKEGHQDLMQGSGDVVGALRIAIYISRQKDLEEAIVSLLNC